MGAYAEYKIVVHHVIRWEIVIFLGILTLGILVLAKVGAMMYYQLFN